MKGAVVLLTLVALAFSAPQPKKIFHEHVEDFLDIIIEVAGHDLEHLMEHYVEFDEFMVTLDYFRTADFQKLILEMESLPEFKAVIDFLERDNIDILYFIEIFNSFIVDGPEMKKARHTLSGRDFSSFIKDSINEFPKAQLAELFDQKMANDEEFRVAIDNLNSEEWAEVNLALWENESFQAEVQALAEHGIEIEVLGAEIMAVFGQN